MNTDPDHDSRAWTLMERRLWLEFAKQPRSMASLSGQYSMVPARAAIARLEAAGFVVVRRLLGGRESSVWIDARIPAAPVHEAPVDALVTTASEPC